MNEGCCEAAAYAVDHIDMSRHPGRFPRASMHSLAAIRTRCWIVLDLDCQLHSVWYCLQLRVVDNKPHGEGRMTSVGRHRGVYTTPHKHRSDIQLAANSLARGMQCGMTVYRHARSFCSHLKACLVWHTVAPKCCGDKER